MRFFLLIIFHISIWTLLVAAESLLIKLLIIGVDECIDYSSCTIYLIIWSQKSLSEQFHTHYRYKFELIKSFY